MPDQNLALKNEVFHLKFVNDELAACHHADQISIDLHTQFLKEFKKDILQPVNNFVKTFKHNSLLSLEKETQKAIDDFETHLKIKLDIISDYTDIQEDPFRHDYEKFNLREVIQSVVYGFSSEFSIEVPDARLEIDSLLPTFMIGNGAAFTCLIKGLLAYAHIVWKQENWIFSIEEHKTKYKNIFLLGTLKRKQPEKKNELNTNSDLNQVNEKKETFLLVKMLGDNIIKQMQGDFHYILGKNDSNESVQEEIVEFQFVVPMGRISDNLPEPEQGKSYQIPLVPEGKVKILVVEDNEVNQLILARNLKHIGYEVELADNGLEAVQKVEDQAFDIILMDINMPVMDGVKATQIIRNELHLDIPIISITANAFESDRLKYIAAGMSDYLKKPFRKDDLFQMLDKYV